MKESRIWTTLIVALLIVWAYNFGAAIERESQVQYTEKYIRDNNTGCDDRQVYITTDGIDNYDLCEVNMIEGQDVYIIREQAS